VKSENVSEISSLPDKELAASHMTSAAFFLRVVPEDGEDYQIFVEPKTC
jgi:hypothetical protein